jgi:HSP20 family protein
MSLTLYRPMRIFEMLDRMYNPDLDRPRAVIPMAMPLDVVDGEDDYVVKAVVPGLKAEDLNIEIKDNVVTLTGETKEPETGKGRYLMDEICYGKFARTLTIDGDLDGSKAEAHLENGLLTLRIPKAESAKPKVVKVLAK